jgi:hypothetical protein
MFDLINLFLLLIVIAVIVVMLKNTDYGNHD